MVRKSHSISALNASKIILAAFLTLTLPLSGAYARVVNPLKDKGALSRCVEPNPKYIYGLKPSCSETLYRSGSRYEITYNKLGLRDKNYPPYPKKNTFRILVLGPSTVYGPGLSLEQTIPKQWEKLLRKSKVPVEVINAASDGYFAVQTAIRLPEYLEAYHPTHVMYFETAGSILFSDYLMSNFYVRWDENGGPVLTADPLSVLPDFLSDWAHNKADIRKLISLINGSQRLLESLKLSWFYWNEQSRTEEIYRPTIRYFKYMNELAKKYRADFYVVQQAAGISNVQNVPGYLDFDIMQLLDRFTPEINMWDTSALKRYASVDLKSFRVSLPREGAEKYTLPGDYHPNQAGAELLAKQLFEQRELYLPKK